MWKIFAIFFTLIQCSDQADFYLFPSRWDELVMKIAIKIYIKISTTITSADKANLKKNSAFRREGWLLMKIIENI